MIIVNDSLQSNSPKSLDNKYLKNGVTAYASIADANATIVSQYRSPGLTVLIGSQEYWYLGGIADINLLLKSTATTINWGNITGTLSNQVDLQNALSQREPDIIAGTVLQYWRGDKTWQTLTSDVVVEGSTNLYFTTSRARQALSAGTGISYNTSTGVITATAPAQVQSNWTESNNALPDFILNKPTIPAQVNLIAGTDVTITGTYPNLTISASGGTVPVTSVGLSMPAAFTVTGSPITSSGTLTVVGAGTTSQYIRGDGSLATLPTATGTVTSVSLTVPAGLTVSGSPVTTAGTIAITTTLNGVVHANGSGFTASNVNLATEVTGNLAISHFNSGTSASGATYWRGDGTWVTPPITVAAGTTGSVQFNNGGAFGADSSLFWDNTNKRLGIGTSSPSSYLHVSGVLASITVTSTSASNIGALNLANDTTGVGAIALSSSTTNIGGATIGDVVIQAGTGQGVSMSIAAAVGLRLQQDLTVKVPNLAGTGTRMVIASSTGVLSTQAIAGGGGTVTSVAMTVPSAFSVSGSPITASGTLAITGAGTTAQYIRGDGSLATFPSSVTSVAASIAGTAMAVGGSPVTTTGTLAFSFLGSSSQYISGAGGLVNFPTIPAQFTPIAGSGISLIGTYPNITIAATGTAGLTSVGLSMSSAFTVSSSPLTANGTITITGAGNTAQYIRGDGTLATLPLQVNADWNATSGLAQILNKPTVVTSITGTANQVIASASTGAVTLSLPQSIATTSTVTFGTLNAAVALNGPNVSMTDATNGGIDVGPATSVVAQPFINFHFGTGSSQAFNVQLKNNISGQLTLTGNLGIKSATESGINFQSAAGTNSISIGRSIASNDGNDFFVYDAVANASRFLINSSGKVTIPNVLQITDGTQAAGKVFTSDASGNGSWQTPSGGGGAVTASNGLTAASNNVTLGGSLTGTTVIDGGVGNQVLNLGSGGLPLFSLGISASNNIVLSSTGGRTLINSGLGYEYNSSSNTSFTVTVQNYFYTLTTTTLTANRTITMPSASTAGVEYVIMNRTASGSFSWLFATGVIDMTGSAITTLTPQTVYRLVSDGSNWVKIN